MKADGRRAVAYVRQSARRDLDDAMSYDVQAAAVRRLAGDPAVEIFVDLGRSGGAGKEHLRANYQAMKARISADEISVVYALNLSRLARSVIELHELMALAKAHDVRITTSEQTYDLNTPTGALTFGMFALLAKFTRGLAVESANEVVAIRRGRGERLGREPYAKPELVVSAFVKAGSFNGAAWALNAAGIPAPRGGVWRVSSVQHIVARERADLLPPPGQRGRAAGGGATRRHTLTAPTADGFALARLLRCPYDGFLLTGAHSGRGRSVMMRCHGADNDPSHPLPKSVAESALLKSIEAEAARYDYDAPADERDVEAERAPLLVERALVLDMRQAGQIDRDETTRRLAPIDAALALLVPRAPTTRPGGAIDWSTVGQPTPRDENATLRAVFERIDLDASYRVGEYVWREPERRIA